MSREFTHEERVFDGTGVIAVESRNQAVRLRIDSVEHELGTAGSLNVAAAVRTAGAILLAASRAALRYAADGLTEAEMLAFLAEGAGILPAGGSEGEVSPADLLTLVRRDAASVDLQDLHEWSADQLSSEATD